MQDQQTETVAKKPNLRQRIHSWLRDDKGVRYFALAILIAIAAGGGLIIWINSQPIEKPLTHTVPKPKPKETPKFYSPLTGL